MLSFALGGTAGPLADGSYIATLWIWHGSTVEKRSCCNDSVVAYVSDNSSRNNWTMRSVIASKQSLAAKGIASEEGPNENFPVLLRDKLTIMVVIRMDGGDGVPRHSHVPYLLATSNDMAVSWNLSTAPAQLLSARPRALVSATPLPPLENYAERKKEERGRCIESERERAKDSVKERLV